MELSSDQLDRGKNLYEATLECDPTHRADFLQQNSTDDAASQDVRRQLTEHENVKSFLSTVPFIDYRRLVSQPEERFAPGEVLAERFPIVGPVQEPAISYLASYVETFPYDASMPELPPVHGTSRC
jgi:hypothetical protein